MSAQAPRDPFLAARFRALGTSAAWASFLLGLVVLAGWALDIGFLKSLSPAWVSMRPNAALCFILCGIALRELAKGGGAGRPARFCAAAAAAIGLLTCLEYAGGWDLGIDRLLFAGPPGAVESSSTGRLSPSAALCFALLGLALLGALGSARIPSRLAGPMALAAFAIAFLGMLGYLYDVRVFLGLSASTRIAAHTAAGLLALSAGFLLSREGETVSLLASSGPEGLLSRRLMPAALILPSLLGWIIAGGEGKGMYGGRMALAFLALASAAGMGGLVFWSAVSTRRVDAERRAAEERVRVLNGELERKAAQLEAANRELEAFSYSVAHDLRAPLRSIDGFSKALLEDCAARLDAEGRSHLDNVRESAQQMAALIDGLLSLSRVGRTELVRSEVDLARVARQVLDRLRREHPERTVEAVIPEEAKVAGDARLLSLVMENLLGNAWKFTRGRVGARIELGRATEGGRPAWFVRDNGAGFDMAYSGKLFGVFQRLHAVSEFEGTGIGLAIVQRIIHRHGGKVWAEGAVGEGATFHFTLGEGA